VRRIAGWAIALGLAVGGASADVLPQRGTGDARLRVVTYRADEVVRLVAHVGYQIDLEFAPGERFVNLAAGDTSAVDVGAIEHHVVLKPKVARGHTNLLIVTTERVYHFDYRIVPAEAQGETRAMWAVRFSYPAPPAAAPPAPAGAQPARPAARNRAYAYCGHPALRPSHASDDGTHTRLAFGRNVSLPAIFVRSDEGEESLVNFHVEASGLIVHQVAPRLVLRRGRLVGCVVNQAWAAPGPS
jgi:type IV secretion system protein VirB9